MPDYTPVQAFIATCPPQQVQTVLGILTTHGLLAPDHVQPGPGELALGECYQSTGEAMGVSDEIAHQLIDAAPGVAFVVWEDPKYEHLGTLVAHHPDHGTITGDCDAEANLVWSTEAVLSLLEHPSEARARMGLPVTEAIDALVTQLQREPVTVTAPTEEVSAP